MPPHFGEESAIFHHHFTFINPQLSALNHTDHLAFPAVPLATEGLLGRILRPSPDDFSPMNSRPVLSLVEVSASTMMVAATMCHVKQLP
jgi:hypothetical protein